MEKENHFWFFDSLDSIFSKNLQFLSQRIHCHLHELANFNWEPDTPKTLVCHDLRGGYLDYERLFGARICTKGDEDGSNIPFYAFFHWWHIDVFIYFSHHFITIPPFAWINQAHKHGVLILGTFIIENAQICQQTFADKRTIDKLIASLVACCTIFKFDGWLINIESEVNSDCLANLEYFLLSLRDDLHAKVHKDTKIIWYDSVTTDGKLEWQNALNSKNLRWFKTVDAFYVNYGWKEENIQQTIRTFLSTPELCSVKSLSDIYMGVDVFGRGCLGGGGWNCVQPMEIIRRYALSAAIFAPGWICEKFPSHGHQILFINSFRFWDPLSKHLHAHKVRQRNIFTNFVVAFASEQLERQSAENVTEDNNLFCLHNTGIQPFYGCAGIYGKDMGAGLLLLGTGIHNLFLCDIPIEETDRRIELRYKSSNPIGLIVTVTDGKKSHHFGRYEFGDDTSDASNKCLDKKFLFEVDGKRGWKISSISIFNTLHIPVRLFMVSMKLY